MMIRFFSLFSLFIFAQLIFTQLSFGENINLEKCGIQLELLGQTNAQEQTVSLSPENTAHIFNHTATQEIDYGRMLTVVMCVFISGEANEEKSAFVPKKSLQQMIARIEGSGIEVTKSTLLDADKNKTHQRGFEFNARQAEQVLYAKGLMVQEPGEMLSYSILIMGHNSGKLKIIEELKRTISSITPLASSN